MFDLLGLLDQFICLFFPIGFDLRVEGLIMIGILFSPEILSVVSLKDFGSLGML